MSILNFTLTTEQMKEISYNEGLEQGMETGRAEGMETAHLEDAKRLMSKGIPLDIIAECTGLTRESLEAI